MTVPNRHLGMFYRVNPEEPLAQQLRSVPIPLLRILLGLALVVAGVWVACGWPWGLVALGAAVLVAELWPEPRQGG